MMAFNALKVLYFMRNAGETCIRRYIKRGDYVEFACKKCVCHYWDDGSLTVIIFVNVW